MTYQEPRKPISEWSDKEFWDYIANGYRVIAESMRSLNNSIVSDEIGWCE